MKLRSHVLIIAAATVLPIVIFVCSIVYLLFQKQREDQLQSLVATARALSLALDANFERAIGTLNALANSGHLQAGELNSFYAESTRILSDYPGAESIVLIEPSGQQIVNTRRPFGAPLPRTNEPDFIRNVADSRTTAISNLFTGAITKRHLLIVGVPVLVDGAVKYVLTMALSPEFVQQLLTQQRIPADSVAAIIDANKTVVARNREVEKYFGKLATPILTAKSSETIEGWWPGAPYGSEPTYAAHRRSEFSGWTVVIGVPRAKINAPLRQALGIIVGGILLFLLVALGLATVFGRRIISSIRALAEGAKSLGAGGTPRLPASPVAELDNVRKEIEAAADKRKRMEAALRQSEERLKAIIQTEPECVKVVDPNGRLLEMNRAGLDMLEADSFAALSGKNLLEFVVPAYREAFGDLHNRVMGGGSDTLEYEIIGLKSKRRWLETHAAPLRNESGDVIALLGVTRDISERKQTESQLQYEFELVKKLADSAADSIFVADSEGRITFVNREASSAFGFSANELQGQLLHEKLHHHYPDGRPFPQSECALRWASASGKILKPIEQVFFHKNGTAVIVECALAPLEINGVKIGAVAIVRDITERKRLEDEVRARADQLAAADRRKDEFLATLAHELRNPLAPVTNAVDILRLPSITSEEFHWATDLISKQMQHMTRLVDDLLDVSRISRDRLELRNERVDLAAVVQRAGEMNRPALTLSGHKLKMTLPTAPIYVYGDEVRLTQVFSNLLNNAVKYTDQGGAITVSAVKDATDVLVTVKDSGIGIAPDQLAHVFEMFAQIDRSMERTQGGLGIGLNLAKRLVEMHGGTIEVKSAGLGKGSEFAVRLPIMFEAREARTVPPGARVEVPASVAATLRILVVDDNRDSAETLGLMLSRRGNTVSVAYDGEAAVQAATELQPDVVILDIGLPKLNGYEACRRIRQQTTGRSMIIIALTGWSRDEDRKLTREAGFDYHMVKPVKPNSIWTLIADLTSKHNV